MKKNYEALAVAFLMSSLFIDSIICHQNMLNDRMGMEMEDGGLGGKGTQIIEAVKALYSLPTISYRWVLRNLEPLHLQGPNLDFRESCSSSSVAESKEGATEKVKEAVVKSLDESKTTVEDSAKSAAKFTEATLDKTVNKLKKALSGKPKVGEEL